MASTISARLTIAALVLTPLVLGGCARQRATATLPPASLAAKDETLPASYIIGPLDSLQVFVWRHPELTTGVSVRPDGRITIPLVSDLAAAGRTPAALADDIKKKLAEFVETPVVQVIVTGFNGPFTQQVRVLGQATRPQAIPYRANMTLLDVMVAVGGLTEYAAGNRATLIRVDRATGTQTEFAVKLDTLIKNADASANVAIQPGDVILIPESFL